MKKFIKIVSACAAIGAAVGTAFIFREEIRDFIKGIINRVDELRGEMYTDCCFDDSCGDFGDFDDFDDVPQKQEDNKEKE